MNNKDKKVIGFECESFPDKKKLHDMGFEFKEEEIITEHYYELFELDEKFKKMDCEVWIKRSSSKTNEKWDLIEAYYKKDHKFKLFGSFDILCDYINREYNLNISNRAGLLRFANFDCENYYYYNNSDDIMLKLSYNNFGYQRTYLYASLIYNENFRIYTISRKINNGNIVYHSMLPIVKKLSLDCPGRFLNYSIDIPYSLDSVGRKLSLLSVNDFVIILSHVTQFL